jgi:hypothetical protein
MALVIDRCAWSADPGCLRTPDPWYDTLLDGHRWCQRCGPLQIERQVIVRLMLEAGHGPKLEGALEQVEAEIRSSRS